MLRTFARVLCASLLAVVAAATASADAPSPAKTPADSVALPSPHKKVSVLVIPVHGEIAEPVHYILRRGLKQSADAVVLDMQTPGGSVATMLKIMETLDRFPGQTITFVNDEAGSAGAVIAAVTDEIYFAPKGVMGAAELIQATGQDVGEALKRKMNSYIGAKIEAYSNSDPRRSDVLKAMMDPNFELKIGDVVIKPKGELLTVTAAKAMAQYGEPARPLLGSGIVRSVDDLLIQKYGAGNYEKRTLEVTWSEELAQFLKRIAPLLMGLGLLAIYIEFKTPGFGVFGITGGVLLAIVFLSNYVAGLSGHEPLLVFALGALLLCVELFFFPGVIVVALAGLLLMFGSLVWSLADIWPQQPLSFSGEIFVGPLQSVLLSFVIAGVLLTLIARFLPHGWIGQRLAVGGAVAGAGVAPEALAEQESLVGREGVAATGLFPSGQVEVDGRRYEARLEVGFVEPGTRIRVLRRTEFSLIVEAKKS